MSTSIHQLLQIGHFEQAKMLISESLRSRPQDANLWIALGFAELSQGLDHQAISSLRRALRLAPRLSGAMFYLSQALGRQGHLEEALYHAQMAAKLEPLQPLIHAHLGELLQSAYRPDDALAAMDRALALQPGILSWELRKLSLLAFMNKDGQAENQARELLRRHPMDPPFMAVSHLIDRGARSGAWSAVSNLFDDFLKGCRVSSSQSLPFISHCLVEEPVRHYQAPALCFSPVHGQASPVKPLRVAYLSADFREHPVAHMLVEVLDSHRPDFVEVVLLSLVAWSDAPLAHRLRATAAESYCLLSLDDRQAARFIREDLRIDVLVDLMGITTGHRNSILRYEPAPTILLWLGCPFSTEQQFYHGVVFDSIVLPNGQESEFAEPALHLPTCYHPISLGHHGAWISTSRQKAGLPEDVLLAGIPQATLKLSPTHLQRVIVTIAKYHHLHLAIRMPATGGDALRQSFVDAGMPEDRLHWLPYAKARKAREDYFSVLQCLDLIIDTYPYGGHSTMGEAICLGIPAITFPGATLPSRVGTSMFAHLGLDDFVFPTVDAAFQAIDRCATDQGYLRHLKSTLTDAAPRAKLLNKALTYALEDVYLSAHGRLDPTSSTTKFAG